jgi:hypothetical protein
MTCNMIILNNIKPKALGPSAVARSKVLGSNKNTRLKFFFFEAKSVIVLYIKIEKT